MGQIWDIMGLDENILHIEQNMGLADNALKYGLESFLPLTLPQATLPAK